MSARRIECMGTSLRPCPAHAWWYYEGRGRPVERCDVCRVVRDRERKLYSDRPRQRCLTCGCVEPLCRCPMIVAGVAA